MTPDECEIRKFPRIDQELWILKFENYPESLNNELDSIENYDYKVIPEYIPNMVLPENLWVINKTP